MLISDTLVIMNDNFRGATVFCNLTEVVEGLSSERRAFWERLWMCSDRRSGPQHPLIYRLALKNLILPPNKKLKKCASQHM